MGWTDHVLYKHEELNAVPQHPHKVRCGSVHLPPQSWGTETGRSQACWTTSLASQ